MVVVVCHSLLSTNANIYLSWVTDIWQSRTARVKSAFIKCTDVNNKATSASIRKRYSYSFSFIYSYSFNDPHHYSIVATFSVAKWIIRMSDCNQLCVNGLNYDISWLLEYIWAMQWNTNDKQRRKVKIITERRVFMRFLHRSVFCQEKICRGFQEFLNCEGWGLSDE